MPAENVAKAIGAASPIEEWRFAAKHWDRVNDPESKADLLKMAEAARSAELSASVSGDLLDYPVGSWYLYQGHFIKVLSSFKDSRGIINLALHWHTSNGNHHTINSWPLSEVQKNKWKRIEPPKVTSTLT